MLMSSLFRQMSFLSWFSVFTGFSVVTLRGDDWSRMLAVMSVGQAEAAVKIVKPLMKKTIKDGRDQFEALLEQRNDSFAVSIPDIFHSCQRVVLRLSRFPAKISCFALFASYCRIQDVNYVISILRMQPRKTRACNP
jgi:hypothetical protein